LKINTSGVFTFCKLR